MDTKACERFLRNATLASLVTEMLNGKIALITGGGRGIGRAIALALAHHGARIAVAARTAEQVELAASAIGNGAIALVCDVSDSENVTRMFDETRERLGDVDILVNNAGIAESATIVTTSDELWHRHLAINLSGTFYCTRAALPAMLKKNWGRIINVASIAGKTGAPYIAAYSASKHGVLGLTRSVALEVAATGITVNAICPSYVDTDMVARGIERITTRTGRSAEEALHSIEKMNPQNRLITPEEVAAVALLLASDEGRGINGQGINIDGGSVLN
jgi:3-hydroxybutyrate dehydrogenase